MALLTCPDCGRRVSTQAFACPQCGRPVDASMSPERGSRSTSMRAGGESLATVSRTESLTGTPIVANWLEWVEQARQLPARSKTCKKCDADVTVDTFRRKAGADYVCSECVFEEQERAELRRVFLTRFMAGAGLSIAAGLVATILAVLGPMLFKRKEQAKR